MTTTQLSVPMTADRISSEAGIRSQLARELNAMLAIAWRDILRAVKSPASIAFTVIFPVLFIGVLGGSISQNLGAAMPYAYLPYMIIGMLAMSMYQGTIGGVTSLVEERENDFTAELFVAPISRYAVLLGKLIGSGIGALVSLAGIIGMVIVMGIPMNAGDLLRVIALAPILALAGGSLGILFIGFVHDPKTAAVGMPLLVFPQMFLSGAMIPMAATTGILGLLSKVIPMTYSIDLARNIFYMGKPELAVAVLHPLWLDLAVTCGFFLVFVIVGTTLFVRSDRNR